MARDYFAVLGLTPTRHSPDEVARNFLAERDRLLASWRERAQPETRQQLDELHLAYATLRDPARQAEYLKSRDDESDGASELRRLIASSLEGGLLRYSRRQAILERAAELGFNEFQAQLLIAQEQFGDHQITVPPRLKLSRKTRAHPRTWARATATGVVALAVFLYLVHWAGV
jgi:hypothetical protein